MQQICPVAIVFSLIVLIVGFAFESMTSAAEETEVLKVTVGEPTLLSLLRSQNTSSVAVSRTGSVAAFYPKPDIGARFYRVSTDGGRTWGKELDYPPGYAGPMSVGLREGGVLFIFEERPVEGRQDQLEIIRMMFADDFLSWETGVARINLPAYAPSVDGHRPCAAKGPIIQLADGSLRMPMYGGFEGDEHQKHRTFLVRSIDQGRNWDYDATIDYTPRDPHPELPGYYVGSCEASVALLPNGKMMAMLRTQYSHLPGEYRPMSVCWSNDMGKTWDKPVPTTPHLMNISPTVQVLDNGVVACQYGRPGFHVAFSIDNGHTWQDRISFSDLPVGVITGQFDMVKVGPNSLVAVGSDGEGTKAWPIAVERIKVSPAHATLTGRVVDPQGRPIAGAKVELGANRYTADCWLEAEELDVWKTARKAVGPPVLGYLSISKEHDHPLTQTDAQGRFEFKGVKLAEYVLTVEAENFAPQWRHIKVGPDSKSHAQSFVLKAGKSVRGRVVDQTGEPVGGVCVVLDKLHIHSDPEGFFHWAVESPALDEVTVKLYKRYHGEYVSGPWARGTFIDSDQFLLVEAYPMIKQKRLAVSRIESEPLVMQCTKVFSW
jgi:hypothetical protein